MFCISVHCFPENASCRFTNKTQGPQAHSHVSPSPRTWNMSIHGPGEEGQWGQWANFPTVMEGPGAPGQREGSGERSTVPTSLNRFDREEGLPEHLPVAPPRALQRVRDGAPSALTRLGSPVSLNFLGFKIGMKAVPLSRSGCKD